MTNKFILPLLITSLVFAVRPDSTIAQDVDPSNHRFITSDLDNFWNAWDRAAAAVSREDSVAAFEELYRNAGSEGLKDFFRARIEDVPTLLNEIRSAPGFYADLRPQTERIREFIPDIENSFAAWMTLYPEADLPDVYFVIGRRNSGGTTSPGRILIGTEMYGLTRDTPDEELNDWLRDVLSSIDRIPGIVAHELIHTQQRTGRTTTLLGKAIGEGAADFLGEMISGLNINGHVHDWAHPREAELWSDFRSVMNESDNAGWLYSSRSSEEPADLGYWMGYQIVEAYFDQAEDKTTAIRDILTIQDYGAFLSASGYDGGN